MLVADECRSTRNTSSSRAVRQSWIWYVFIQSALPPITDDLRATHQVLGHRYVTKYFTWCEWSLTATKVAVDRTSPGGRVIGIDIIPAQPPKGVSTIQGNFLSESVQEEVKNFLRDPDRGRPTQQRFLTDEGLAQPLTEEELEVVSTDYLELERRAELPTHDGEGTEQSTGRKSRKQIEEAEGRMVDVVLSDMCEPWEQITGFWKKSLSDPYHRMMNTSGNNFRDHAGSMVRISLGWSHRVVSGKDG
jgi:23S rRNA U2552 (ribose-2'-O)-methylase RlmE/FtsJ